MGKADFSAVGFLMTILLLQLNTVIMTCKDCPKKLGIIPIEAFLEHISLHSKENIWKLLSLAQKNMKPS